MEGYSIKCSGHTYVSLFWNDKFLHCFDNDMTYAEDIISQIEKRTKMRFRDIPIIGNKEDFNGLRFRVGGWKRKVFE